MSSFSVPPPNVKVLIIGGGPAGSYAASVLGREGISCTLLESSKFPRYHVGESLIPSVRHFMRFIDADEKLANVGFIHKPGSAIKFNQFKGEGYTDFIALGAENSAYNVAHQVRSEFDHLLLNHARSCGASVYEQTKVTSIDFAENDSGRPVSVSWSHAPPPPPPSPPASPTTAKTLFSGATDAGAITGSTTFDYLIDASGRGGLLSNKYFKTRQFNKALKNIAIWGYWTGTAMYGVDSPREGAPWFEALTDETGWAWFIPLHDGSTSVGVVMDQKVYAERIKSPVPKHSFPISAVPDATESVALSHYLFSLSLAPGALALITKKGKMSAKGIQSASDYSYTAKSYADAGYRIVGDAGALTICASMRGHCSEIVAADWHTKRVSTSYTRFQVVVLSAYKQIRAQSDDVLSDVNEANFDRALRELRPIVQGAGDMGKQLSETELQRSLDFCLNIFNPTTPEQHEHVASKPQISPAFLDVTGPLVDPDVIHKALHVEHAALKESSAPPPARRRLTPRDRSHSEVAETTMVLAKVNARRVVHAEYAINNFESEPIEGRVAKLQKGNLGLTLVDTVSHSTD
ncbi:unnamed protein product [Mycena citricolor]|uniref:Halogenase n=1 Tax=Mycena citricolor TaxID=2018698 RepID=A0AAD2GYH8_9AGAR|nr:unnamed protein product [Mycena citricolor]CAK5281643.1 unnamed protein product [Mycena citricolor]